MLVLSQGVKCKQEDNITQRTACWVWGPPACRARTLSPTCCVTSWSNSDVNPCPVCLPGLLWEIEETMCVKRTFAAPEFHKCKLLWLSLVVFGKLASFYRLHALSTPPIGRSNTFWPLSSEWGASTVTGISEVTKLSPLIQFFQFRPWEKPAPHGMSNIALVTQFWGEVRQS